MKNDNNSGTTHTEQWDKLDCFIFDVDGTLYDQKSVRLVMLGKLLRYYGLRPKKLKELLAVQMFRHIWNNRAGRNMTMDELNRSIGKKLKLTEDKIRKIINKWMFTEPMNAVSDAAYQDVAEYIQKQYLAGKRIVVYSDYPVEAKMKALGLPYHQMFVSGEGITPEHKPSETSIRAIINCLAVPKERVIYIGNSNKKDKKSAEAGEISYCDIKEFRKSINKKNGKK